MTETIFNLELLKKHGLDCFISGNCEIRRPDLISLGNHVAIDTGFYCTTGLMFGDYIHIGPYTTVIGGKGTKLTMGHFSGLSAGCRVICSKESYLGDGMMNPTIPEEYRASVENAPVLIQDFATVFTNVIIGPGVTIGQGCIIGANSLVIKDTDPWTIYAGSPAKPIKIRSSEQIIENSKKMGYDIELC